VCIYHNEKGKNDLKLGLNSGGFFILGVPFLTYFLNKLFVNFLITLKQNYWEKVGNCEIISEFFLLGKKGEKFKRGRKTEVTIITDTKKYNQKNISC